MTDAATPSTGGRRIARLPRIDARTVAEFRDRLVAGSRQRYDELRPHLGRAADAVHPLADAVRRSGQWVSPVGWITAIGAVGGLTVGVPAGWTELRVIGLACLLLLLGAVAWVFTRAAYEVRFDLQRTRVVAGETATGRLLIRNKAKRSFLPTRIELNVGRGRAHFTLPGLGRDEEHEQLFDVPTRRRGVISIGPVSSVRSDPLGALRRTQQWAESVDLYVHPVTVPLTNDSTGFIRDIEGVTTRELSSNDVSFHALREYQPGDDRRAIHWRTTARTGRLMVRQFEETRRSHLLVLLPTASADFGDETDFESAISIAGSLARHAFTQGREVSLFTSEGLVPARTAHLLLDRLADLQPARRRITLRDLATRAVTKVPQVSIAAIIAGSDSNVRDVRAAHRALPMSVTSFALRCGADLHLQQRRLGDLTQIDLPDVHALPGALRSIK